VPKTRTASARRTAAKLKKIKHHGVTADDVVTNLIELFDELGIDLTQARSRTTSLSKFNSRSHTLYPHVKAIGEMLASWHQDPAYLDNAGNPSPIKLRGSRPSFRSLAQRAIPKIDEIFLLSELERFGAVAIDESNFVHVKRRSFPIYQDKHLAIEHTLVTLDGFIRTLRHNLSSEPFNSDQLFHRIAWNSDFDSREIPALKVRVKRHGQNFLDSLDNWLSRNALSRKGKSNGQTRRSHISIGVYLTVEKA
jgi:hypothetical protein